MKYIIYVFLIFWTTSCKSQNIVVDKECNENSYFKNQFFYYINNIEAYTFKKKNLEEEKVNLLLFKLSLEEISNYVDVNYTLLANYEFGYPSQAIFNKEKERWLMWYKENKCKNLQWK